MCKWNKNDFIYCLVNRFIFPENSWRSRINFGASEYLFSCTKDIILYKILLPAVPKSEFLISGEMKKFSKFYIERILATVGRLILNLFNIFWFFTYTISTIFRLDITRNITSNQKCGSYFTKKSFSRINCSSILLWLGQKCNKLLAG